MLPVASGVAVGKCSVLNLDCGRGAPFEFGVQ